MTLSLRAEDLLRWCHAKGILLSARHIAGKANVLADALSRSRGVVQTEWTLNRDVLQAVWDAWDLKPMVDLFATKFSKRLPVYVSPVPDPEAWGVDALSFDWSGLIAYAFPPFPILSKVVRKARIERPQLILVAPFWPAQTWFPDLQELSHVPPLALPARKDLLRQPRSGVGCTPTPICFACTRGCCAGPPVPTRPDWTHFQVFGYPGSSVG